jgi:hypothetical protein
MKAITLGAILKYLALLAPEITILRIKKLSKNPKKKLEKVKSPVKATQIKVNKMFDRNLFFMA